MELVWILEHMLAHRRRQVHAYHLAQQALLRLLREDPVGERHSECQSEARQRIDHVEQQPVIDSHYCAERVQAASHQHAEGSTPRLKQRDEYRDNERKAEHERQRQLLGSRSQVALLEKCLHCVGQHLRAPHPGIRGSRSGVLIQVGIGDSQYHDLVLESSGVVAAVEHIDEWQHVDSSAALRAGGRTEEVDD